VLHPDEHDPVQHHRSCSLRRCRFSGDLTVGMLQAVLRSLASTGVLLH
jgi:hypothetical protein